MFIPNKFHSKIITQVISGLIILYCFAVPLNAMGERLPSGSSRNVLEKSKGVDVKGFIYQQRLIRGRNWALRKVQDSHGDWVARLEVDGVQVKEFSKGGKSESWVRFLLWPIPPAGVVGIPNPDYLFILRYGGGVNGPEYLDIVDVRRDFQTVFESGEGFNFQRVEDLDENGTPEVIGYTREFIGLLGLPETESPMPTIVLSYDKELGRYVCRNGAYKTVLDTSVTRFAQAFESVRPLNEKIVLRTDDPKTFLGQFAPLVRWVVELYYAADEKKARETLHQFATQEAAKEATKAIENILSRERFYRELSGKTQGTT